MTLKLEEALKMLKESGKLSDADVMELLKFSTTRQEITKFLHLLLCTDNHDTTCTFLQEELFDNTWSMPAHIKWNEQANEFVSQFEDKTDEEVLSLLKEALSVIRSTNREVILLIQKIPIL